MTELFMAIKPARLVTPLILGCWHIPRLSSHIEHPGKEILGLSFMAQSNVGLRLLELAFWQQKVLYNCLKT